MKDRFGDENRRFQWINDKGAKIASLYGFDQVRKHSRKFLGVHLFTPTNNFPPSDSRLVRTSHQT